jgi:hypothetical protein
MSMGKGRGRCHWLGVNILAHMLEAQELFDLMKFKNLVITVIVLNSCRYAEIFGYAGLCANLVVIPFSAAFRRERFSSLNGPIRFPHYSELGI